MLLHSLASDRRIILASKSPRRKALLKGLNIPFEIIVREGIDEDYPSNLLDTEVPAYLAKKKSSNYTDLIDEGFIVITSDTIVSYCGEVIGKPSCEEEALELLRKLCGNMHEVITAVCISSKERKKIFSSTSKVWMERLEKEELEYYVKKYKPFDKAGGYGIQEWIGYVGIRHIEGSFYNVMGLPTQKLYAELKSFLI